MTFEIQVMNVTPKLAEQWLNANTNNRKMRDGVAEKYADDMRRGNWTTCPEPITFFEDGSLADGQHRLWAILDANVSIRFPVARGLSKESGLNINTGLGRTLVDNARISGANTWLTNTILGVARAVETGTSAGKALSPADRLAQAEKHGEAVRWAVANGPKGTILRNALVLGAIARAWYLETDLDRLRRFGDVVTSGFMDGEGESAAVAIRNYLQEKGSMASTQGMWRDTFLKVQNAISYFMKGKKLTVIKTVKEEAYPLKPTRLRK